MNFQSTKNLDWRVFRVMAELVEGFDFVSDIDRGVTVLGTRSAVKDSKYGKLAYELGVALQENNFATITGGAEGIPEEVNRGAFENGGESIGLGLEVHGKQRINHFVSKSKVFKYPFTRKLVLTTPTKAFVFFPGGFGTLHQLFEVLTLIQTRKMEPVPVILVDHEFWTPMHQYIKETLFHTFGTISDEDDELYQIVDTVDAVMELIEHL